MSGMSMWMSDLGGYNKTARTGPDSELFMRWTEYSALSTGMEVMSAYNWGPWDYGDEALRVFREYSILHMSLFPYRYAAAQESARNGLPIMRSLVLMHQDDPDARAAETEYYLGPDLLVAPVLSPVTQRAVYLPQGDWIDYWTGRALNGKQTLAADAPRERIPLYVRAGAMLPKIPNDIMTLVPANQFANRNIKSLDDRRVYEVYAGSAKSTLRDFEDRTLDRDGNKLTISGKPAHVILRWRFAAPRSVSIEGRALPVSNGEAEFDHRDKTTITWE